MLIYEVARAKVEASTRALIVLHGLGDSMDGYRWMPQALQIPWLNYLLVNAPDPYYGGYSWYDFGGDADRGIRRSRGLLFDLLDALPRLGFGAAETALFGFSQGSLMVMEAGARYPRRFAGVIGVSGYVHQPETLIAELSPVAREQRFLATHGTEDPLIPLARVRPQFELLRRAGLKVHFQVFDKPHTIVEEELYLIREFIMESFEGPRSS